MKRFFVENHSLILKTKLLYIKERLTCTCIYVFKELTTTRHALGLTNGAFDLFSWIFLAGPFLICNPTSNTLLYLCTELVNKFVVGGVKPILVFSLASS